MTFQIDLTKAEERVLIRYDLSVTPEQLLERAYKDTDYLGPKYVKHGSHLIDARKVASVFVDESTVVNGDATVPIIYVNFYTEYDDETPMLQIVRDVTGEPDTDDLAAIFAIFMASGFTVLEV